jgi:hypothetical protein
MSNSYDALPPESPDARGAAQHISSAYDQATQHCSRAFWRQPFGTGLFGSHCVVACRSSAPASFGSTKPRSSRLAMQAK